MEAKWSWIRAICWANPIITSTPNKQWESFLTRDTSTSVSVRIISYCLPTAMQDTFCAVRSHLLINEHLACEKCQRFNRKGFFFLFKEISERLTCVQDDLNFYINGIYVFSLPERNNYDPLFHKRLWMAAHRWDNTQNYAKKKKKVIYLKI